jgi:hypothetical protein
VSDEHDPGRHLVVHRAPRRLLGESRRAAGTPGLALGPLIGAAAGLLVGGLAMWGAAPRAFGPSSGGQGRPGASSPARPAIAAERLRPATTPGPDGTELRPVALVYRADDAREVTVAGTFNGWDSDDARMQPMGDGLFRVVLWLPPGQYEYQFVVDGTRWTPDPLEARHRDDGFGSANSVLDL